MLSEYNHQVSLFSSFRLPSWLVQPSFFDKQTADTVKVSKYGNQPTEVEASQQPDT